MKKNIAGIVAIAALALSASEASADHTRRSRNAHWHDYNGYYPNNAYPVARYPSYETPVYVCRGWDGNSWYTGTSYNGQCRYRRPNLARTIVTSIFNVLAGVNRPVWRTYQPDWYNPWYGNGGYGRFSMTTEAVDVDSSTDAANEAAADASLKQICKADVLGKIFVGNIRDGKCYMPSPTGVDLIRANFEVLVTE